MYRLLGSVTFVQSNAKPIKTGAIIMKKFLLLIAFAVSSYSLSALAGPEDCGPNWYWDEATQECKPKPVGSIRG